MVRRRLNGHPADHELLLSVDPSEGRDRRDRIDQADRRDRRDERDRRDSQDRRDRRPSVEQHLRECTACRGRVDVLVTQLEDAAGEYRRLFSPDGTSSLAMQRARLARTLVAMPAPRQPWWSNWILHSSANSSSSWSTGALPAWAMLAAAVGVITLLGPWAAWRSLRADDARPSLASHASLLSPARELPVAALTPGSSASIGVPDLCAGRRPSRIVPAEVRQSVLRAYGMEDVSAEAYELDALITPELGGTTDARNLWPQRYASLVWHARVKDVLEERLAADVCAGRVELRQAQHDLATDWVAAYRRYFKADAPLQAHLEHGPDDPDEPELEIEAPRRPQLGARAEALALMALPGTIPHWDVFRPGASE